MLKVKKELLHEKSSEPLDKVCLIGKNGTGKSTLLKIIKEFHSHPTSLNNFFSEEDKSQFGFEVEFRHESYFIGKCIGSPNQSTYHSINNCLFKVDKLDDYHSKIKSLFTENNMSVYDEIVNLTNHSHLAPEYIELKSHLNMIGQNGNKDLLIFSPSDSEINRKGNNPSNTVTLNEAQKYFKNFPYYHELTYTFLEDFWSLIIFQIKKRENEQLKYYRNPENQNKVMSSIEKEFLQRYPEYLAEISKQWNVILTDAGLYFDYEKARIPTQLTDSFMAYFKTKHNDKQIEYSLLSSGIKHLLFRTGYLTSLFYKRDIENAAILIDEPEISLFPDLLLSIIENYTSIFPKAQYFFATHSPIVASQFDPAERIILEFNEEKKVENKKGEAPEGDDPNDLLLHDFGLINILGKKGEEALNRYIELKSLIYSESNNTRKSELMREFLNISTKYNFGIENETNN